MPSPAFIEAFLQKADSEGVLPFSRFMELALYHPVLGYYRRDKKRVGRSADTDFYTATSSGSVFGEMVAAACANLLGGEEKASDYTFVEIGAEPAGGVLKDIVHPFADYQTLRVGDPLTLSGKCVVFSNELFDAQPLQRLRRVDGAWREVCVRLDQDHFEETLGPSVRAPWLPTEAPEGYQLDAPVAARELAHFLGRQTWTGAFVAFDYGKTWEELSRHTPQGTARAYHLHQQHNDLLARPGDQDLTGHVCWDWLSEALSAQQFSSVKVAFQESFLIHHAGKYLEKTLSSEADRFSPRKMSIMQLLHPGNLGQKFQVLSAVRGID